MSASPRRDWITILEAAELLGCTTTYARKLVTSKRIHAEQAGGVLWLLYRPDVLAHKKRPPLKTGPRA